MVRRHFEPCFDDPRVAATQNIGRGVGEVITKHANRCPPPKPQRPSMVRNEAPPDKAAQPLRGVSSEVLPSARQLSTIHAQPMPPFIIPCSRGVGGPGLVTTSSLLTGTSHTARKPCLPTHGHQPVPKTPQASLTPSTKHIHNVTPSPREHGILEGDNGRCEPKAVRTRGRTMGPTLLSAFGRFVAGRFISKH